jgi:hypothetical protein
VRKLTDALRRYVRKSRWPTPFKSGGDPRWVIVVLRNHHLFSWNEQGAGFLIHRQLNEVSPKLCFHQTAGEIE